MEVCDAPSASQCFSGIPYLRLPCNLSQLPGPAVTLEPPYIPYQHNSSNVQQMAPTIHAESTPPYSYADAVTCRNSTGSAYQRSTAVMYDLHGHRFYTQNPFLQPAMYSPIVTVSPGTLDAASRGDKTAPVPCTGPLELAGFKSLSALTSNFDGCWPETKSNLCSERGHISQAIKVKSRIDGLETNAMLQQAQSFTHWDVNDPKLPKIRNFDTFTMWPQGQCRYAYQKSASEGARRHASGWAMRNTNNHNAQILKKSCLGVLLCTAKGCSLAMRPAICDKARRRQEGRQCCMPNCTGRIFNQPCRGHGGYPVTHFWRELGDTVYFQAKGTHDHIRPDLKPVRDTAARRRRQMNLDKLYTNPGARKPTVHTNKGSLDLVVKMGNSHEDDGTNQTTTPNRKRLAIDSGLSYDLGAKANKPTQPPQLSVNETTDDWGSVALKHSRVGSNIDSTSNFSLHPFAMNQKAEPIFPISPSCGNYSSEKFSGASPSNGLFTFEKPKTQGPLVDVYQHSPTHTPSNANRSEAYCALNRGSSSANGVSSNYRNPAILQANFLDPFVKKTYEQDLIRRDFLAYDCLTDEPHQKQVTAQAVPQSGVATLPVYRTQPFQVCANLTGGGNSEPNSAGLNASWSTPSPPTGGSSSLFGSEFRTFHSGPDDNVSHNLGIGLMDSKETTASVPTFSAPSLWRSDGVPVTQPQEVHPVYDKSGYDLVTLTAPYQVSTPGNSQKNSPDSLLNPSTLMSASTPLSSSRMMHCIASQFTQSGAYSNGYITPIPFYQSDSDSRSTKTDSSGSNEAISQRNLHIS